MESRNHVSAARRLFTSAVAPTHDYDDNANVDEKDRASHEVVLGLGGELHNFRGFVGRVCVMCF